jgi:outer membrane protein
MIITKKLLFIAALFAVSFSFSQKKWTLKEAVDQALEKNISIKQNQLSLELSKKDVAIAKGNFLPNLNGSSSGRFNAGLSPDENGILRNTNNLNASFDLSGSGTIFNGYRNLNSYKQAQLGVASSKFDLEVIENDISLFVVNGYLNILFAKENLEVAKVQYEISKTQVEAAVTRFKAGAIAKGDVLNAESTVANDLQNIIAQENALDIALLNLAQSLQVPVANFDVAPIEFETPSSTLLYSNSQGVYEKAISNRPEIERAKIAITSADLGIEIAKGAYLPTLSYNYGLGTSYFNQFNNLLPGQKNNDFFTQFKDRFQYGTGLSLNIPIFNRNQTKNNVAKSVINKEMSQLGLENEKIQLKQTIEQSFLDVKSALKSYEAARSSLKAQKEAFKNAQERYNYGAMTLFDFDLVRSRLVNAESTLIRSKYDYVFKTKVLQFYSGDLVLE